MNLPEPVSQAARWALVMGLAFFSADVTSALIQKKLQVEPKPLPVSAVGLVQENVPAQAAPPGLVSLLKTTESEKTVTAVVGTDGRPSVSTAPTQAPSNLKLRGTMAGGGGTGLAMIDINGTTQVVSTGEEIGGMILTEVTAYSIRLEGRGQTQVLQMDDSSPTTIAAQPVPLQTPVDPTAEVIPAPEGTPDPNASPAAPVEVGAIMTQRELRNILDNPTSFASKGFRMKPVLNGGEIIGMRVSIQDQAHPLARLGIKDGDVVKSLNGNALNGPEALSSIYRVLRNTSSLSFDVQRGGADEKIDITLEE